MKQKISIFGIGYKLAPLTIVYSIIVFTVNSYTRPFFSFKIPWTVLFTIITFLLIIGISFLIASSITMIKAYKADVLYTRGVYSVCRHPIYSAWILFIIPALVLYFRSWLILTIPVFMYVIFAAFIKEEENYLKDRFPNQYLEYKAKTSQLFPMFWKLFW
jgi:protein-S-isoprenylcysteine O-methyltransferase Ste14